ncbi:hypothetical protein V6Z11_A07G145800 [Gossypium hirsutum]
MGFQHRSIPRTNLPVFEVFEFSSATTQVQRSWHSAYGGCAGVRRCAGGRMWGSGTRQMGARVLAEFVLVSGPFGP